MPSFTYQQLKFLFILVQSAGAKLLALRCRTYRPRRHCRSSRSRSIAFEQHRNHRPFCFLHERKFVFAKQIDADEIPQLDLSSRDQVGEWKHDVSFNRPFQMARSIFRIRTF